MAFERPFRSQHAKAIQEVPDVSFCENDERNGLGSTAKWQFAGRRRKGGMDVFISIDKKIEYEQNLFELPLPVVILDTLSNALPFLPPLAPAVNQLLTGPLTPALYIIQRDGEALRLTAPRQ